MADYSLRGSLIRRLLLVLLSLGVAGALFIYGLSSRFGGEAYDRALYDSAVSLAQQVTVHNGKVLLDLPPEARAVLLNDQVDTIVYRAVDLYSGRILDQNADLGPWSVQPGGLGQPFYRDEPSAMGKLRIVGLEQVLGNGAHVLIEVGETRNKRDSLTREIALGLAVLMAAMVTMTIILVSRGTTHALAPLTRLEADAATRSMENLAPLNPLGAPREVRGLIEAINRLMTRLGESVAHQRRFTGNAAHQLRTPLAALRLQAQLALKGGDSATQREALLEIEANAARTAHIIDQLLTLARAEGDGASEQIEAVQLGELARDVMSRFVRQALAKQIDLGFEGQSEVGRVMAYPGLLSELVSNLLDNAIRYTHVGGRVTVSVERDASSIDLLVYDNGPGIELEEREQVFQRFYRSDTAAEGGVGLGLAIVREIAERHHAQVVIEDTRDGAGCCFRVSFPEALPGESTVAL
ncbi:MAG: sensor histidine kinase N-terminal domain-containing protein [Burkholderiales bacterium]|nr:sensor histidine kinase N-terminal domain-containing protein [Burkholderiales bacterium]